MLKAGVGEFRSDKSQMRLRNDVLWSECVKWRAVTGSVLTKSDDQSSWTKLVHVRGRRHHWPSRTPWVVVVWPWPAARSRPCWPWAWPCSRPPLRHQPRNYPTSLGLTTNSILRCSAHFAFYTHGLIVYKYIFSFLIWFFLCKCLLSQPLSYGSQAGRKTVSNYYKYTIKGLPRLL